MYQSLSEQTTARGVTKIDRISNSWLSLAPLGEPFLRHRARQASADFAGFMTLPSHLDPIADPVSPVYAYIRYRGLGRYNNRRLRPSHRHQCWWIITLVASRLLNPVLFRERQLNDS